MDIAHIQLPLKINQAPYSIPKTTAATNAKPIRYVTSPADETTSVLRREKFAAPFETNIRSVSGLMTTLKSKRIVLQLMSSWLRLAPALMIASRVERMVFASILSGLPFPMQSRGVFPSAPGKLISAPHSHRAVMHCGLA